MEAVCAETVLLRIDLGWHMNRVWVTRKQLGGDVIERCSANTEAAAQRLRRERELFHGRQPGKQDPDIRPMRPERIE